MLEGETLVSTENIGFPISHLLDGGNVSVWLSQLEHSENEYIVARTHIVGHNVCDHVAALPDVLEIPGAEVFPAVPNPSVMLRNGVWYTCLQLFLMLCHGTFH